MSAPTPTPVPPATTSPANRWTVLAVLCAALLIVVIDVTVLHIAAPAISEDLRPSAVSLLWIIDVYPLVVAPLLVTTGALGDRFGRKRILISGLVFFCAASVLAAFAWSPAILIVARALQGVGGAMIMPSTMSIIRGVFPDRQERVRAIGIWSATLAGGAAVGPLLGGFLVEHFSWGAVFLINVPVLAIILPFALKLLPESRSSAPPPWDLAAVVLVGAGILGLALGVKLGSREGFLEPAPAGSLIASVLLLAAFVRRMLTRAHPMLDLRLFARPAFSVAVGCVLLTMFALVGLELFFAQYLQLVLDLGPLAASVRLVPLMLSTIAGSLTSAWLLRRYGTRRIIAGGLALSALSLIPLLALGTSDQYLLLLPSFVLLGAALEVALVAANDTILSAVDADGAGQASAIEETAYELGGGLGVAILGSIGAAVYTADLTRVPGVDPQTLDTARESLGEAVSVSEDLSSRIAEPLLRAARDSFVDGFHVTLVVAIAFIGLSALLAAVVLRGSSSGTTSTGEDADQGDGDRDDHDAAVEGRPGEHAPRASTGSPGSPRTTDVGGPVTG